jgi:hypothetical protein
LRSGKRYINKMLGYGPIAYWPQGEKTGAVAYCRVNSAQNGAYTGVTLGQPGIGDGNTAPFYDGANDYTDIYTATFSGNFDGSEGSFAAWFQVSGAGVWTDVTERKVLRLVVDGNNLLDFAKRNVNNRMDILRISGGASTTRSIVGLSSTAWLHLAATWSETANQYIVYLDGVQQGAVMTAGVWGAGPLVVNQTVLGAVSTAPGSVWDGYLAHAAFWDSALSTAAIADLATL